jgi:hypothetical protein
MLCLVLSPTNAVLSVDLDGAKRVARDYVDREASCGF